MTYTEAKEYISMQEPTFLTPDHSGKGYICPICGSGSGKHGTGITRKKGMKRFICWANHCTDKMDMFSLYGAYAGVDSFRDQLKDLCAYYGITIDAPTKNYYENPFPLTNDEVSFLGLRSYVTCTSYSNMSYEKPKKDGAILQHEWMPGFISKREEFLTKEEKSLRKEGHDSYFLTIKDRQSIGLKTFYLNAPDDVFTMLSGKLYECLQAELLSVAKIPWTRQGHEVLARYKDRYNTLYTIYKKLAYKKNDYLMMSSFYLSVMAFYINLSSVTSVFSFYEMLIDFSINHLFTEQENINIVEDIKRLMPYVKNYLFIKAKFHNDYMYTANAYYNLFLSTLIKGNKEEKVNSFKTRFMELYLKTEKDYKNEIWKKRPDKAVLIKREIEVFFTAVESMRVKYFVENTLVA